MSSVAVEVKADSPLFSADAMTSTDPERCEHTLAGTAATALLMSRIDSRRRVRLPDLSLGSLDEAPFVWQKGTGSILSGLFSSPVGADAAAETGMPRDDAVSVGGESDAAPTRGFSQVDVFFNGTTSVESSPSKNAVATLVVAPEAESKSVLIRTGQFFFKYRDLLSPIVFATLVLSTKPHWFRGNPRSDMLLDGVGLLLILIGLGLRAAVIGFAYIKRGGKDKQVYADALVTEGFFAHSRNPLYVGNYLTIIGLLVIDNSPWAYVIGIAFYTLMYWTIVLAEEDFLRGKFGAAYQDYCGRVNRFVLSFKGLSKSLADMSYDWKRFIRKEYGTTFSCLTTVLGLLAWERFRNVGWAGSKGVVAVLAGIWIIGLIAYVAARVFKKQGSLGRG
jgi:protein-S-isoprenylcysteine O-methyltransferase Ste14